MFILFAPGKMPDRVLQAEIGGKLAQRTLAPEEFPEVFQLFAQTLNSDPRLLQEAALRFGQPNWCCQVNIGKEPYGLWATQEGCFACCGMPHAPTLIISAGPEEFLTLLSGEVQRGDLRYNGSRQEALALQCIFECFLDQYLPFRAKPEPPESQLNIGILGAENARHFIQKDELVSTAYFDSIEALLESGMDAALVSPVQTLESWQQITRACERYNLKCMAADLPRFVPAHNYIRKIVRAGLIGEVRTVRVLASDAISFATLAFILGCECAEITAVSEGAAIARFENNALVHITREISAENAIEIYGTAGVILENHAWAKPVRFLSGDPRMAEDLGTWVEPYIEHMAPDWEALAARKALHAFAKNILENKEPDLTSAQTAHGIACFAAMMRSIEEGRAVAIAEIMTPEKAIAARIQPLPQALWQGYELPFRYETAHYYDMELVDCEDGLGVAFTKKPFEAPVYKSFSDKLYEPYWENAQAWGILEDGGLVACIELWKDSQSRLRVTQMWVSEDRRRQGYGTALMDFAKTQAREQGCRALILETQSCNEAAIAFYQAQGFGLFGFDRSFYSNQDIENREVRLEMGLYF